MNEYVFYITAFLVIIFLFIITVVDAWIFARTVLRAKQKKIEQIPVYNVKAMVLIKKQSKSFFLSVK